MRMTRFDHNFTAYVPTQDANGFETGLTALYASFDADIQSFGNSTAVLSEFGLNSGNIYKLYHDTDAPLPVGAVLVDKDTSSRWQVMGTGPWQGHLESVLKPWEGDLG